MKAFPGARFVALVREAAPAFCSYWSLHTCISRDVASVHTDTHEFLHARLAFLEHYFQVRRTTAPGVAASDGGCTVFSCAWKGQNSLADFLSNHAARHLLQVDKRRRRRDAADFFWDVSNGIRILIARVI